jgi:hypothetical protein
MEVSAPPEEPVAEPQPDLRLVPVMPRKTRTQFEEKFQRKYDRAQDKSMLVVFPSTGSWDICDMVVSNAERKYFRHPNTMGSARTDDSPKYRWWYAFASFKLWNRHPAMKSYADGKGVLRYMLEKYWRLMRQKKALKSREVVLVPIPVPGSVPQTPAEVFEAALSLELEGMTCNDMICALTDSCMWQEGKVKGPLHALFWKERVTINNITYHLAGMHYRVNIGQDPPPDDNGDAVPECYNLEIIQEMRREMDSDERAECAPFTTVSNIWKDVLRSMTRRRGKVNLHNWETTPRGLFHDEPKAIILAREKTVQRKAAKTLALASAGDQEVAG